MIVDIAKKTPFISLALLWLAYAFLGWYLSAHHVIWLVGAFIVLVAFAIASKSIIWLESLVKFGSQTLVVVLALSASIALVATWSLLFSLLLVPLATTILANIEMGLAGFSDLNKFLTLTIIAAFGLAIGEMIDIAFIPSLRF
ncbi:MAG: hypothetical protein KME64_35965 [Scytonematopsis contorta HA4267-MV1]|jgi:hypothetical protein|nr:hypothetical protein [Scytonematopsis contorta HA4267-MV1]